MKHISEIIQLEALVIRIVYVCCVDTNECYETTNPKSISNWNILYIITIVDNIIIDDIISTLHNMETTIRI